MKKLNFLPIFIISMSIALHSCSSASEEKVEVPVAEIKPTDTVVTVQIEATKKVLTAEEEQLLLAKIPSMNNPEELYQIYLDNESGSKIEQMAYKRWEKVMLAKISSLNDPELLYKMYLDNSSGTTVEQSAYAKWEQIMLVKISSANKAEDAYQIYLDNNSGSKVEQAAYARYKKLGGKD